MLFIVPLESLCNWRKYKKKNTLTIESEASLYKTDKKLQENRNHDKYVIMIDGEGNALLSW